MKRERLGTRRFAQNRAWELITQGFCVRLEPRWPGSEWVITYWSKEDEDV